METHEKLSSQQLPVLNAKLKGWDLFTRQDIRGIKIPFDF